METTTFTPTDNPHPPQTDLIYTPGDIHTTLSPYNPMPKPNP